MKSEDHKNDIDNQGFRLVDYIKNKKAKVINKKNGVVIISLNQEKNKRT